MLFFKKIIVCCPGEVVTGGPELLHQLVDTLRGLGHDAYISYYPFNKEHNCPDPYKYYDCPQAELEDEKENLIILPEVKTKLVNKIKKSKKAVWWLSVDNYYGVNKESAFKDFVIKQKSLIRSRAPLRSLMTCYHFTQSFYAKEFLSKRNIKSVMLTDYLSREHFNIKESKEDKRKNLIVYNPKKGRAKTKQLISTFPDIRFIPIQNMTKQEVAELLSEAKIYMDFGNHPGKDRLPREAALAGCCIITGKQGAASNSEDIPIPNDYKIDDNKIVDVSKFEAMVNSIFNDYDSNNASFNAYRSKIRREPDDFRQQVLDIFGKN